ncbi:MAG: hypothetical protein QHH26_11425 [Armatimonadota bacterium]|nr:hypothetical protein [Armatimonadota bacterium]
MPSIGKTLKKSFADSYDYLGLVLFCSFLWFGIVIAILSTAKLPLTTLVHVLLFIVLCILLLSPITAGVLTVARKIAARDDPSILDLFLGFKHFLIPAWKLGTSEIVITVLLVGNIWFYLTLTMPLKLVSVFFFYLLLAWIMSMIYHYPLLIEQNPGTLKILKRGFLLMLDNLGFTTVIFLAIIMLTCLCIVTLVGLPLLYAGMVGIFATRAARALFIKYGILPPEPEPQPVTDDVWRLPD